MKIKPILADMSGRLQGIVASHNRGGQYFRGRTIPDTPPTAPQTAVRVHMATCVNNWTQVLTNVERSNWNDYAAINPEVNGFGDQVNIGGLGWFVRANISRLLAGIAPVTTAPVSSGPAGLTPPTVSLIAGDDFAVAFNDADAWANQDDGALLLFASRGISPTRFSAAGIPLQFAGIIPGDSGTAPTSPQAIATVFSYVTGQKVFYRLIALEEDGRRSPSSAGELIVT